MKLVSVLRTNMGSTDGKRSKLDFLCQYTTVRKVSVRDPKLALTYFGTILLVFIYVIVYTIIIGKGIHSIY